MIIYWLNTCGSLKFLNEKTFAGRMAENQEKPDATQSADGEKKKSADSKREASWPSVLFFIHLNILGLYGIVVLFTNAKLITIAFCKLLKRLKNRWNAFTHLLSFHFDAHGNLWNHSRSSQIVGSSDVQSQRIPPILADDFADHGWAGKRRKVSSRKKSATQNLNFDFLN